MSLSIRVSDAFVEDFERAFSWYLDEAGIDIAWRFQNSVDSTLHKLADRPDLGRPRHFRNPKLQHLRSASVDGSFNKFLIFYRADDRMLDVIRLMHGARDIPKRLLDPPSI